MIITLSRSSDRKEVGWPFCNTVNYTVRILYGPSHNSLLTITHSTLLGIQAGITGLRLKHLTFPVKYEIKRNKEK